MASRSSVHSSTEVTLNKIVLGRVIVLLMRALVGRPVDDLEEATVDDFFSDLQTNLQKYHDIA